MDRYPYILGCLLGTAIGDAVGLRREGLSKTRALRMYGGPPLAAELVLGRGYCSDDTEHTVFVARALAMSAGEATLFERELAGQLKRWVLAMPAGTGFATFRACCKLLFGYGPARSGVASAGNGPAMRAALLGVYAESEAHLIELIRASTRITHTDPRAEEGAMIAARAARLKSAGEAVRPAEFIAHWAASANGAELRDFLQKAAAALLANQSCVEFVESCGWTKGVSGYINHTVPAALYCWAKSPNDFRECVEQAALLGGDTDTVAAITGGICGANLGADAIPKQWINQLREWPRSVDWMTELAAAVNGAASRGVAAKPPNMRWLATIQRNIVFAAVVIALGFRRLLPPY